MTTAYPGGIDNFTNPASTDTMSAVPHDEQHANANDAIEAIETALGADLANVLSTIHSLALARSLGA